MWHAYLPDSPLGKRLDTFKSPGKTYNVDFSKPVFLLAIFFWDSFLMGLVLAFPPLEWTSFLLC